MFKERETSHDRAMMLLWYMIWGVNDMVYFVIYDINCSQGSVQIWCHVTAQRQE